MDYIEITFKVPVGSEDIITTLVMLRIEAYLSEQLLKPTQTKITAFQTATDDALNQNNLENKYNKK